MPDSARARAEAELCSDPARSNALIAALARCTRQDVDRWRHVLERAGQIPRVNPQHRRHGPAFATTDVPGAGFYRVDEIDRPCCTMEWSGGGWQHDRSCSLRLAAR